MRIKETHKRKIQIAAVLVCFSLIGVTVAQIVSNTLFMTITVTDPDYTIAFIEEPSDLSIIEESSFSLEILTYAGDEGSFEFRIDSLPAGVTPDQVLIQCHEYIGTMPADTYYPLDPVTGVLLLPWKITTAGVVYTFHIRFLAAGEYSLSVALTPDLPWV